MADTIQLFIAGISGKTQTLNVKQDITIGMLVEEIADMVNVSTDEVWMNYAGRPLQKDSKETLHEFKIQEHCTIVVAVRLRGGILKEGETVAKKLTALPGYVTLTKDKCMITHDYDMTTYRAKMSCGHVIGVDAMTMFAKSQIDDGHYRFFCQIVKECTAEWPYFVVRHVACLQGDEQKKLEQKIGENYGSKCLQKCPGCFSNCVRDTTKDIQVICPICTKKYNKDYKFCWCCLQIWQSSNLKHCGNTGCDGKDPRLRTLLECPRKTIVKVDECPSVRACPKCGILINHTEACKHMTCRCRHNFCFICLKGKGSENKWQCGSYNTPCQPAPIQTEI